MISSRGILLLVLTLAASAGADEVSDGEKDVLESVIDSARIYEPADVLKRVPPVYPQSGLRRYREAWVVVSYCIDEEGNPQNMSVLDSAGSSAFERAAIRAVGKWEFQPAQLGGNPSWQSNNKVLVSFTLEDRPKGASRRFIGKYKKLSKLIKAGDLDEAKEMFEALFNNEDLNLYEIAKLWNQRVVYELARGDYYRADLAIHRATASKGKWIEEESYISLLSVRVKIELRLGQYSAALSSYDALTEVAAADDPAVVELQPIIEDVRQAVEGDVLLTSKAEVRRRGECYSCDDSYAFSPVRRHFTFSDVKGQLASIEMRCTHKRFVSEISDLVEWRIPESWGDCSIQVYGEPGTTFEVLQFPDA